MCNRWWLDKVQSILRKEINKSKLFSLHDFLLDIPREVRSCMIQNTLKAGCIHMSNSIKEIPSVNKALVFLSSEIQVREQVYLSLPIPSPEDIEWPLDLELLCLNGKGIRNIMLCPNTRFNASMEKIIKDLCKTCIRMTHVTITLATDDAIAAITLHCKSLLHIDVSGSPDISDDGVSKAILNLKSHDEDSCRIKFFDISKTSITEDSIIHLITRLPSLTSLGSTDIGLLECVERDSGPETILASLEKITLTFVTVRKMKLVVKYFPKVTSIKVTFHQHPGASLDDLLLLKELAHVDIVAREPFFLSPKDLQDFIWAMETKLKTLKVSGDISWEVDLGTMVANCPGLHVISIPAVVFPTKESLNIFTLEGSAVLRNLTELQLDCMTGMGPLQTSSSNMTLSRKGLVVALKCCVMLRDLIIRPTCLVDTDFIDIFAENRLEHLEVLGLYNSCLGPTCGKMIIDTCQNLHVMKGLITWRGMTFLDIVHLRRHARGHKRIIDLKIVP